MATLKIKKDEEMAMKLLHYFITEKNYNPIVLHGAKDEIWLENMDEDYKIIRIVTNYIHNDEQIQLDLFKTEQVIKQIKKKTFYELIESAKELNLIDKIEHSFLHGLRGQRNDSAHEIFKEVSEQDEIIILNITNICKYLAGSNIFFEFL